jgi:hypothetical protein
VSGSGLACVLCCWPSGTKDLLLVASLSRDDRLAQPDGRACGVAKQACAAERRREEGAECRRGGRRAQQSAGGKSEKNAGEEEGVRRPSPPCCSTDLVVHVPATLQRGGEDEGAVALLGSGGGAEQ